MLLLLALGSGILVPAIAWRGRQETAKKTLETPVPSGGPYKYTNKLAGETSPYLLEHAHNPVNWYPWNAEALDRAQREKKLIFLSIGYSACHWCHVMAREDFENEAIAKILNDNFICIKVDREQRPDIDAQYMMAVQMMTGSGGWPLSVFLTPERKPFFGGTYFPPEQFTTLLNKVVEINSKQAQMVLDQADKVAAAVAASGNASRDGFAGKLPSDIGSLAVTQLAKRFDKQEGGFAARPKFPEAPGLAFLLARYHKTGDKTVLAMVTTTLDHMADGGIYDQIGGGFHRYSTDALWRVPHFEKMLYDQAQLVPVYLDAYRITHNARYRKVVEETLAFVGREMRDTDGGFTSTLDADSEGEEGKFYLWTPDQVKETLGGEAPLFAARYGVTPKGDLEGKSVLHVSVPLESLAREHTITASELNRNLEMSRQKLLAARGKRIRPRTDDKVLASWNGLMLGAFAQAAQTLGQPAYKQTALEAANFLTTKMTLNGKLQHSYRAGKADVAGLLEDYAFVAKGMLDLYAATEDKQWLEKAQGLAAQMVALFYDIPNGGFFATTEQGDLLARLKDSQDNAVPSGNGIAAQVLARLAALTGKPLWREQSLRTVQAFGTMETRAPSAFPSLLVAYDSLGTTANLANTTSIVQVQASPLIAKAGQTVDVVLHLHIRTGWHINAHIASAEYLVPTMLRFTNTPTIQLVSLRYPDGQTMTTDFAVKPLSMYQNEVVVQAKIRVMKSAPSGRQKLRFTLAYQPCNTNACLAPAQTQVDVPLLIQ